MKEGNTLSIVTVNMIDGNYANEYGKVLLIR